MIFLVPRDDVRFPTLGPAVCAWAEQNLVFGPGDLRGQPLVLDDERRALIHRLYEIYPRGHAKAGRRRFKRAGISVPKGLGKTELAAIITACELHPEAPVRFNRWDRKGNPIGKGVTDPFIPLIAYTEEQSDELAFTALRVILEHSPIADAFDIGLQRILRKDGDGRAEALASSPDARDGARTTFAVLDETHRWTLPRLKHLHTIIGTNIAKRFLADGWQLEVTTAPEPGAGSVAEATMAYARAVDEGRITDPKLFFFHRQASDRHDLSTEQGRRGAVIEASGAAAAWRDIDAIVALWDDPGADAAYLERVYLNRLVKGSTQAFNVVRWDTLAAPRVVPEGARIVIGFDGALFFDSTAIVCTEVETGYQWLAGLWERPLDLPRDAEWQVPIADVDALMRALFETHDVWRLYADPPYWQTTLAEWARDLGEDRIVAWYTTRRRPMTAALEGFHTAIQAGSVTHDGDERFRRHIGNARRADVNERDGQGKPLWLIRKARPDSIDKIDAAMAAVLSWAARTDAIASGATSERSVWEDDDYELLVL